MTTPESGLRPRNSGLKGPHTYAQPFLTSNGTRPTSLVQLQLIENRKTVLGAYHADHEKLVMTEEQLAQATMSPVMVKNTGVPMAPVRVRNTGVPMSLSM